MSVDYNSCNICGDARYEEYCTGRVIDGEEITVCDDCIEQMIEDDDLVCIVKDSEEYNSLSDEEKKKYSCFGSYYKRTKSGKNTRIKEIDLQIESLQKEKEALLQNM